MITTTIYELQTMEFGHGRYVTQASKKSVGELRTVQSYYTSQEKYIHVRIIKIETTVTTIEES